MEQALKLLVMVYTDDPLNTQIESKSSLATFSQEFSTIWQQINYKTLEKTALYITCDLATMDFDVIASLRISN